MIKKNRQFMCSDKQGAEKIGYRKGLFISNLVLAQVYRDFSVEKAKPYFNIMDSVLKEGEDVGSNRLIEYHLSKGYF